MFSHKAKIIHICSFFHIPYFRLVLSGIRVHSGIPVCTGNCSTGTVFLSPWQGQSGRMFLLLLLVISFGANDLLGFFVSLVLSLFFFKW